MVLPVIAGLPIILGIFAGTLAIAFGAVLLGTLASQIVKVVFIGFAAYMFYLALPNFFGKDADRKVALFMFVVGLALAYIGVTGAFLQSISGNAMSVAW